MSRRLLGQHLQEGDRGRPASRRATSAARLRAASGGRRAASSGRAPAASPAPRRRGCSVRSSSASRWQAISLRGSSSKARRGARDRVVDAAQLAPHARQVQPVQRHRRRQLGARARSGRRPAACRPARAERDALRPLLVRGRRCRAGGARRCAPARRGDAQAGRGWAWRPIRRRADMRGSRQAVGPAWQRACPDFRRPGPVAKRCNSTAKAPCIPAHRCRSRT